MPTEEFWKNDPDEDGALPPCQQFISMENPDCGAPAQWGVLIKNKVTTAVVDLCDKHKTEHERKLAALRRRLAAQERAAAKQHAGK